MAWPAARIIGIQPTITLRNPIIAEVDSAHTPKGGERCGGTEEDTQYANIEGNYASQSGIHGVGVMGKHAGIEGQRR